MPLHIPKRRVSVAGVLALLVAISGLSLSADAILRHEAALADSTFSFTGGGFGHGAGLSQYGARGAARAGLNADQILTHYYTGASIGSVVEPPDLRVRIASPTTATVATTTSLGTGEATLLVDGNFVGTAPRGIPITLSAGSGRVAARIGDTSATVGAYAAIEYGYSGSVVQVGPTGTRFDRGVVVALPAGDRVQINVNRLSMTDYLYGLAEMPSSWETPALEAQAVAGRSYAIHRRRGTSSSFDLESTTVDQVFAGYDKAAGGSFERWKAAVDATVGRVVKAPDGSVANALYSSGHGGYSEDNDYVFGGATSPGTPVSYLRAITDQYEAGSDNPYYRWTRSYTGTELGSWFGTAPVTGVRFGGPFGRSGRIDRAQVTLVTASGNKTVRGDAFRRTINDNVAFDRELLSTLLFLNPQGSLDNVVATPGGIRATGWAWDPTSTGPTSVDIYIDGKLAVRGAANESRPDVGAAVAGAGNNRGFTIQAAAGPGTHDVCAFAIDDSNQNNPSIGCRRVAAGARNSIGNLENARPAPGAINLSGWALDQSRTASISVHAYVDGRYAGQAVADKPRPDVGAAYPAYGAAHGFDLTVPAGAGTHQVCAYPIDDEGDNPSLGCRSVTVEGSGDAIGTLEGVRRPNPLDPYTIQLSGWALDLDTTASIAVHGYLSNPYPDGTFLGADTANGTRSDVAATYPGKGDKHGFSFVAPYVAGRPRVCAHGINQAGGGASTVIGCMTPPNVGPFGNLESIVRTTPGEARIQGWALDPDATGPITLHVYVGGPVGGGGTFAGSFTAGADRADVGSAYPGFGNGHGFDVRVGIPGGSVPIYVYAIDNANDLNPVLGSRGV